MPKIQWKNLPPALRDHLFDRLRERKITVENLYQLKLWRETEPEAPEGLGIYCSGNANTKIVLLPLVVVSSGVSLSKLVPWVTPPAVMARYWRPPRL